MSVLLNLLAFAVAFVVSVLCALFGLGKSTGPDIGFAGGGIWLLIIPGVLLGLVIAFFIARRTEFPRTVYVLASGVISLFGGAIPTGLFKLEGVYRHHTTFVYIPAADYTASLEIEVPSEGLVGQPLAVKARYREGPWQQVKYADYLRDAKTLQARFSNPSKSSLPPAENTTIAPMLTWYPYDDIVKDVDRVDSGLSIIFRRPGTYQVQAEAHETMAVKSNVVAVTVRAPEFVYVPAADYSAKLEATGPSEGVPYTIYPFTVAVRHGPFEKIRFADLRQERYRKYQSSYRVTPPDTPDAELARKAFWFAKPDGVLEQPLGAEARVRFMGPGAYEVTANITTPWDTRNLESNAVKITVRDK